MALSLRSTLVVLCLGIFLGTPVTRASKILVISTPLRSHFGQGISTGKILAEAGHKVWVLTPEFYTDIVTKNSMQPLVFDSNAFKEDEAQQGHEVKQKLQANPGKLPMEVFKIFTKSSKPSSNDTLCHTVLTNATLMETIESIKFDLVVKVSAVVLRCLYLIPYKFDIPYISMESGDLPIHAGVPGLPSFQPFPATPKFAFTNQMTFFERVVNTFGLFGFYCVVPMLDGPSYVEQFAPEKPPVSYDQLASRAQMYFVNVNIQCIDYPRVYAPNYHFLPGLTREDAKPLPKQLNEFVDSAEFGVIYISFGSTAMGTAVMEFILPDLLAVLGNLKQKSILQIKSKVTLEIPANVKVIEWAPQNDILGHPKCVLFIAHGGANGQMETIYHGVPAITVGFSDEQQYNGRRLQSHGMGLMIPIHEITQERLSVAIKEVTENSTYRERVRRCAEITRSLPSGKETMLLWTEHVLKFGGEHLRLASADMPLYAILMFDVAAFLAFLCLLTICFLLSLCYCTYRGCKKCFSKKEKTE